MSVGLAMATFFAGCFPFPSIANAEVTAEQVQRSLDRGIAYLRKEQDSRSGGWPIYATYPAGLTSLCTLALLNAGVPADDPTIVGAMGYIRRTKTDKTYCIALKTLVYCHVGAAVDRPRVQQHVEWLTENQTTSGQWSYGVQASYNGDPSNTQFALLALGAAVDRGFEVDPSVFEKSLKFWQTQQASDGGWSYSTGRPPTGSMTSAGIASMVICQGHLPGTNSVIDGDDIRCCGSSDQDADPVESGLRFLAQRFSTRLNPGAGNNDYFYYMYALERVGRLTGRRFIGEHDWYREGAESLINRQDAFEGFWRGQGNSESRQLVATSFALLFLGKGKRQVVIARLRYPGSKSNHWNQHPDSLRHLVRHVERDWSRDLTWQTVDISQASVADLLQTPVLLISGSQAGTLTQTDEETLKGYVDQGGTIIFEAEGGEGCGDATPFLRQTTTLCKKWFPKSPPEKLPLEHPVWYAQRKVDPTSLGENFWIYGIQACCRTPIFILPRQSLSCRWELSGTLFQRTDLSDSIKSQLRSAVSVGENIIAYATGRELKDKLEQRLVVGQGGAAPRRRGTITLGELAIKAGGEDASRAMPNAVSLLGQSLPIAIAAADQPISFDAETLAGVEVLWVHGRSDFSWDASQQRAIRTYLDRGGIVIGNAVCGSPAFAEAFRRELESLDPNLRLTPMSPDDAALTNRFQGYDIRSVTIREPKRNAAAQTIQRRKSHPLIEIAKSSAMPKVFFSPLDLSCALESQNSVQCPGYSTDDATKILANLILYAMNQTPER